MCTRFPLFQLLHFLSPHPSLTICNPPYLGPHSGTQCFPNTSICLRLISHVVCVRQKSAHTHTHKHRHTNAWNYWWRIQGLLSPDETRKKKNLQSNLKQNQLRRSHQTGRRLGLFFGWVWLRVGKHTVCSDLKLQRQTVPRVEYEQIYGYCTYFRALNSNMMKTK